jgi:3-deoxy-7-phosphoheptulonate synthase
MNAISKINNINIKQMTSLISPADLRKSLPVTEEMLLTVNDFRRQIANIIHGKDKRILAFVGPCSIHDRKAALEYADKLKDLQDKVSDKMLVVMRVYFEKPRTTIGWRGLITDPRLDGSFDIAEGLHIARGIMIEILEKGLAVGSEILDPIVPQYISDLISWASIGARTTESQVHREISSGLSMPVGFKNSTDGKFEKAINAIRSSNHPHSFIGIDDQGLTSICRTKGNINGHLILRGGDNGPNYHVETIEAVEETLKKMNIAPAMVIDCSHSNSGKKYQRQNRVLTSIIGHDSIKGFMLESNLFEGNQPIPENLQDLKYGVSITDACISWTNTEQLILQAYKDLNS